MATTTPNFGWTVPTSSDLVKNGATAIETLGDAIDASLVDLKGGTTGQVLSKASNTDMDFVWAADAGAPTSLGYAAGKNRIINGDFNVNQRALTSTTTSGTYGHDRWLFNYSTGTVTYSNQAFTAGTAPVAGYEATQFAQIVTSGQSATSANTLFDQRIEDVRTFAGQTATLSFWAKAGSGTQSIAVEIGQSFGTGGSPSADVNTYAGKTAITTSWARYSITVAIPSISGKTVGTTANTSFLNSRFWLSAGTDFNARTGSLGVQNATIQIWGVQLEAGSTATAFQTATGTIQGELAACQRYYWRSAGGSNYAYAGTSGMGNGVSQMYAVTSFPVTMRIAPSSVDYANIAIHDSVTVMAVTTATISDATTTGMRWFVNTASTSNVFARPNFLINNNNSAGYLAFNAEL